MGVSERRVTINSPEEERALIDAVLAKGDYTEAELREASEGLHKVRRSASSPVLVCMAPRLRKSHG